ncbi:hypothetical protein SH248x_002324 [Planctomycetaceae bacterium SH248]
MADHYGYHDRDNFSRDSTFELREQDRLKPCQSATSRLSRSKSEQRKVA